MCLYKLLAVWVRIEPEPVANIGNILDEYLLMNEVVVSTERKIARINVLMFRMKKY